MVKEEGRGKGLSFAVRRVILLADVMHVSVREAKFDASCNIVTASRSYCKWSHPCTWCVGGYFSYHLATQVWNTPSSSPKKRNIKKKKEKNTTFRHALPSRCDATLAVIWGLFVIFSGALSGRRADISESAQKPPEWCHAQLMSPGSNSISLMNSSHSGGMLMVEVPRGIKGRNAANAPTLPFDLTSVYLHLTYSPPPLPHPRHFSQTRCQASEPPPPSPRAPLALAAHAIRLYAEGMRSKRPPYGCAAVTIRWTVWKVPRFLTNRCAFPLQIHAVRVTACNRGETHNVKGNSRCFFCKRDEFPWGAEQLGHRQHKKCAN